MSPYLKLILKRYFFVLSFIVISSLIISPDLKLTSVSDALKSSSAILFYRFNIFSVFSLLFASLTSIQAFEKENINVALSVSGMHSFRMLKPAYIFATSLTLLSLGINEFFLPSCLRQLKKDAFLSDYKKNLDIHHIGHDIVFSQKDGINFGLIDKDHNVTYAKKSFRTDKGFELSYVDQFQKTDSGYVKTVSTDYLFLPYETHLLKEPSQLKISASLSTLFRALNTDSSKIEFNKPRLQTTLAYRLFLPLLHIFALSIAAIFGFSQTFRRRTFSSWAVVLILSLSAFYFLECTSILSSGGLLSPFVFITFASLLVTVSPLIAFAKKV